MADVLTGNGMQINVTSRGEENFLRIANLLLLIATPAVREKFNEEFHPARLETVLKENRFPHLDSLKQKNVINPIQWDLLFPVSGNTSSEDFDLTLMICLINNFTNISVSDKLPFDGDISSGADLSRLKYYRNKIMHSNCSTLTDRTFNKWWEEISEVVSRLGGAGFEERCNLLQKRRFAYGECYIPTEFENRTGVRDPVPKGLRKLFEERKREWKKVPVAKTRAIRRLEEMIRKDDVAVAVGPSGCGKSTAIHFIALQLELNQEYEIIISHNPEDMRMLFNPDNKQVFVIDDVFGIVTFDENKAYKWLEMSNDIKRLLKGNHTKVLASCKTHIFQHRIAKTIKILSKFSCDFVSTQYCLTDEERLKIAKLYLTKMEIRDLMSAGTLPNLYLFPVLCRYYSNQKTGNIVEYFANPTKAVRKDLNLFFKSFDQTTFATLFLFVVFNNCIMESAFTETLKTTLDVISKHFYLKYGFSVCIVKNEMENLMNTYLKKHNSAYTLIHDQVFDILVYVCGSHVFDLMIDLSHSLVIRNRFVLKRLITDKENHDHIVEIPLEKENKYLERLYKDIKSGNIQNVFLNRNLNCSSFRFDFRSKIDDDLVKSLSSENVLTLLMAMMDRGLCDIESILLIKKIDFDQRYWDGETLLFKAVGKGCTEVVRVMLKQHADPNYHSCLTGLNHIEKIYPGITVSCHNNETRYRISDPTGPFDPYEDERLFKCTSLHTAERKEMQETNIARPHQKVILRRRKFRYQRPKTHYIYPLHIAVYNGNIEIVKLLLLHNAKSDFVETRPQIVSPLAIALNRGFVDILQVLLERTTSIIFQKSENLSQACLEKSLKVAVEKGYYNVVSLLLNHTTDTSFLVWYPDAILQIPKNQIIIRKLKSYC